jgi:small redox-active disulfide protein 2
MEEPFMKTVSLIEILGPGCGRCQETHRIVAEVVKSAGLECNIQKITSIDHMTAMGVIRTPAVAFDGQVVLSGHVPTREEVRQLLDIA